MVDRSIVARLRAEYSQLRAGMSGARTEINATAKAGVQANQQLAASALKESEAEKVRAAVRKQSAVADVAASEKSVIAAQRYGAVTSAVTKHRDDLEKVGRGFTVLGAAAGLGLGVAVKTAASFDQEMANVASTGADAKANYDDLREAAVKAGAATQYSANEAADGVENLLKAGVSAKDVLGGGLTGALNLAAAGGVSVADAAEDAASAMTQFGLSGKDVPHIADLLAEGAGTAAGEVSDMAQALKQSGLVAAQFGLNIDDTVGTLALFAKNGLIGSDAGTSFKTMLLSLASPSVQAKKTMDAYGLSVYDAQGKFIGITKLADLLHDKLGGLSQAQRNAALSTIFGSDAIRAASILYKDGAAGIRQMQAEFLKYGTAADVARTKNDNLMGDLRNLSGSVETALIGSGDGLAKDLRGGVQAVTDLVNEFNELPGSAQNMRLLGVAVVAGTGLAIGGLIKLATTAASAKTALTELNLLGPGVGSVGRIAQGAAAGVGVLAVALAGLQLYTHIHNENVLPADIDDVPGATAALTALSKSYQDNASQLDGLFQSASHTQFNGILSGLAGDKGLLLGGGKIVEQTTDLVAGVHNLDTAFAALGKRNWNTQLEDKVEALFGFKGDFYELTSQVGKLDQGLVGLGQTDPTAAGKAFTKIAQAADRQGVSMADLTDKYFPKYKASLAQQADQLGITNLSAQDYIHWMEGIVPPTVAAAQAALGGSEAAIKQRDAVKGVSDALQAMQSPLARTAEQSSQLAQQIFAEGNAYQASVTAHAQYEASLDAANKQLDKGKDYVNKSKTALKDNTDAARANLSALNDLSSSGKAYVQSLIAQGAGSEKAQAATAAVRKQFVAAAQDAGLNEKAANKLADSYGLIPSEVSTKIDVFGIALQQTQIENFRTALAKLPKEQQAKIIAVYERKGAKAALDELDKLNLTNAIPGIKTRSDTPKVTKAAQALLDDLKDGTPGIKTSSDAKKVSADAQAFLRAIKGVNPKVLTQKDLTAAAAARAYIAATKGKTVTIRVAAQGASAAQAAIDAIHGRTVAIRVSKNGPALSANAEGGPIVGPGTGTSDDVLMWGSNGEYMQTAAAHAYYGTSAMDAINQRQIPKSVFSELGFAAGGSIDGLPRYASGGSVDLAAVRRLLAAIADPVRDIVSATNGVTKAATDLRAAQLAARNPAARLQTASTSYNRAVTARNKLKTEHADDVKDEKDRIAVLERRAKATKGTTAADRELTAARAKLAKLNRDYSADLAHANDKVTATSKTKAKAEDAYKKAADRSKAASDALKDAQSKLADANSALADSTKQVASSFYDAYSGSSVGGISDWLQQMNQGATDITVFQAKLDRLRKLGLNAALIDQLQSKGTIAGGDLADQLLQGGKSVIAQIDASQVKLQAAANNIGLDIASGGKSSMTGVKQGSAVSAAAMAAAAKAAMKPAAPAVLMRPITTGYPAYQPTAAAAAGPAVVVKQTNTFPAAMSPETALRVSNDQLVARLSATGV